MLSSHWTCPVGEAAKKRAALGLVSPMGEKISAGPRLSHPVTRDGHCIPFFPAGARVIVERLPEDAMIGGLHIPDSAKAQQQYATLVAAGLQAQAQIDDMGLKIGDTICFGKYAGQWWQWEVENDGTEATKFSAQRMRRVDAVNVADIMGGQELAGKIFRGEMAIMKRELPDGQYEYRFFDEQKRD